MWPGTQWEWAARILDNSWWAFNILPYWVNTPAIQEMNAAVDKYYLGLRSNTSLWQGNDTGAWA